MSKYNEYIKNLEDTCLLVDYEEYKSSLQYNYINDKEILKKFKAVVQQIENLLQIDLQVWIGDAGLVSEVVDILSSWDDKVVLLKNISKNLNKIRNNAILGDVSNELLDTKHFIYQEMVWSNIYTKNKVLEEKISAVKGEVRIKETTNIYAEKDTDNRLKILDDRAWESALLENTVNAYEIYIDKVNKSALYAKNDMCHLGDANRAIEILQTNNKKSREEISLNGEIQKNRCTICGTNYPAHYSRCPKDGFRF